MKGFHLFWELATVSKREILADKKSYVKAFFALIILGNADSFFPLFGITEESNTFLLFTLFATLLTFVVLSHVVLFQKEKHGGRGELKFFVPTFLLYNLYYSFFFFVGLLFLIIPGIYALFYFSMAPMIAVLDDSCSGNYFLASKNLVKKNLGLVMWASLMNLLVEISAIAITPIQDPRAKVVAKFLFSLPDAFFTILMTVLMVKVYYYLMKLEKSY
jgi:hypothetical protein